MGLLDSQFLASKKKKEHIVIKGYKFSKSLDKGNG